MDTATRMRPAWMLVLLLAGCREPSGGDAGNAAPANAPPASVATPAPVPEPPPVAANSADGVSIRTVPGMHLVRDFGRSYMVGDRWKADAEPDDTGTPLLALVMDGSNEVTAAELRIGRSSDPGAVARCETVPDHAEPAGGEMAKVDGVPFRRFAWSDAGMSHYMEVDAYRAVRNGQCLAIDLLLTGTQAEVYDPPRQPPFEREAARERLGEALAAVQFGD